MANNDADEVKSGRQDNNRRNLPVGNNNTASGNPVGFPHQPGQMVAQLRQDVAPIPSHYPNHTSSHASNAQQTLIDQQANQHPFADPYEGYGGYPNVAGADQAQQAGQANVNSQYLNTQQAGQPSFNPPHDQQAGQANHAGQANFNPEYNHTQQASTANANLQDMYMQQAGQALLYPQHPQPAGQLNVDLPIIASPPAAGGANLPLAPIFIAPSSNVPAPNHLAGVQPPQPVDNVQVVPAVHPPNAHVPENQPNANPPPNPHPQADHPAVRALYNIEPGQDIEAIIRDAANVLYADHNICKHEWIEDGTSRRCTAHA
ncbi:hypothetical protein GE21DRAFT_1271536 [Neurospora crassa]|nr:hypothetical protein GE21DRAFT_1271536 [Neurospora crassa]